MSNKIDQEETSTKARIGWGVKVPRISFEEAIQITKRVSQVGGLEGSLDVLAHVVGNSVSSSTFKYKLSALRNFGLFVFPTGDTYSLSDVGRKLVNPESPEVEERAVVEAFCKHDILNRTWENYKGKLLPQREYLANFIEKSLNIPGVLKLKWADYFIEAARFSHLILERESGSFQVLSQSVIPTTKPRRVEEVTVQQSTTERRQEIPGLRLGAPEPIVGIEGHSWGIFNQRTISGDRKAFFAIPDELTQEDIDALRVILKGIDTSLDGLKRHEAEK